MAKRRDPVIDSMRGIGIVLMVLGHSGYPGTDFIYLFHMALFFMLSGWLFSLRGGPVHFIQAAKPSRSGCPLCWQTPPLPC